MSFNSQYKKINDPVKWFPERKRSSSNSEPLKDKSNAKGNVYPATSFKMTSQHRNKPYQPYNKHSYTNVQNQKYTQPRYMKPYTNTNSVCYKYNGNPYALVKNKYKWVKPKEQEEGKQNKKEEVSTSNSSNTSSNSEQSS